jgi:hypothetical protein
MTGQPHDSGHGDCFDVCQGHQDDEPLDGFATWQEQTAALEGMARAAGLDDEPCGCRSAYVHDHRCTKFARAAVPVGDGAPGDGLREQDCGHYSWAGLMRLLDEEWPADIFPTRYVDDPERDAGPRIVSLMRWVQDITVERDTLAAALDRVRAELDRQQRNCADCRQGYDDKHTDLRRALDGER